MPTYPPYAYETQQLIASQNCDYNLEHAVKDQDGVMVALSTSGYAGGAASAAFRVFPINASDRSDIGMDATCSIVADKVHVLLSTAQVNYLRLGLHGYKLTCTDAGNNAIAVLTGTFNLLQG